jgi:hypothetical protein
MDLSIQYNFRDAVRLYNISSGNAILNSLDYIKPIRKTILYLPPEIEIIDVYHKLYLPNNYDERESLKDAEMKLYDMVISRAKHRFDGGSSCPVHGSAGKYLKSTAHISYNPQFQDSCASGTCDASRQEIIDVDVLRTIIFQKFIRDKYVVIGHWGVAMLTKSPFVQPHRTLQVISSAAIDFDVHAISSFLSSYTTSAIRYKERRMNIPKDFRIKRYTIRILSPSTQGGVKEKTLLDIYNVASYELVPYISKELTSENIQYKIGTPYVLLRFVMIDLIIIRMIGQAEVLTADARDKYIEEIIEMTRRIKKIDTSSAEQHFGINVDYIVAKRMEDRKESNQHPSYLPELALRAGKYKIVY